MLPYTFASACRDCLQPAGIGPRAHRIAGGNMISSHAVLAAPSTPALTAVPTATSARYLTNSEAADYQRLSPRTLEKLRVLGGGPRFRQYGRRVLYRSEEHTHERQSQMRISYADIS